MYWGPEEQWDVDKWNQRPKLGGNEKNVFQEKNGRKRSKWKWKLMAYKYMGVD